VDHGKTTLVDGLLKQSGLFRSNERTEERMMDSMDQERERGITIAAKNASYVYKDIKVNIVDTPGHSDFGGEVERILNMVDGAILLVDASEGPLPQTRFVLSKALKQGIKVIVCVNKIDRPDRRIPEVMDEIFSLFVDLAENDDQADFDTLYAVARDGFAVANPEETAENFELLFDWVINKLPPPKVEPEKPLQMIISNLGYSEFVGRLAIGRIQRGSIKVGQEIAVVKDQGVVKKGKVKALFTYVGMKQVPAEVAHAGDIVVVAGVEEVGISDTICDPNNQEALPRLNVEEPTVSMIFSVNDSPFAGLEGDHVTSRKIWDRLEKETLHNVAIRVEQTESPEKFKVMGRGELQLAVIIEQMRREGFELLVSKPQVIMKQVDGVLHEPMEMVTIDVPSEYVGAVTEKLGTRKGIMQDMNNLGSRVRVKFAIPSRGLIGYRSEFLTDTRGTGLISAEFNGWAPHAGEIMHRRTGTLISDRKGSTTMYALGPLQERGRLFVTAQTEVYEGMVVGENSKENDLIVNAVREKKLTNVRASGADEKIFLAPIKPLTLEFAMEWISDHELIEVTPENIRMRCVHLDPNKRKK
ncbi:MAG: translational GTPase TypA, partial [Bdellovibrionales bacterium]|nr:translational GTPase TypA [Bdellovibrionales bacterium]